MKVMVEETDQLYEKTVNKSVRVLQWSTDKFILLKREKMRRQGQYTDSSVNSYASAQTQHLSAQRMQHGSGMNHFPGRPDTLASEEEHPYISSKAEGQWQWDREGQKGSAPVSSHIFSEGQRGDSSRSFYHGQRPDPKVGLEKQTNYDQRAQPQEQDMEIGYEETPFSPTYEGLELKFHDDIIKLTKEQDDAEDAENTRHREKLGEINAKYTEKLTTLRAQHASRRDDFLRKESQARHHQYQQAGMSHYQNTTGLNDTHGYAGAASATAAADAAVGEGRRPYGSNQFDSYRERAQYLEDARNHGMETRGPNHGMEPRGPNHGNETRGPNHGSEPRGANHGIEPRVPYPGGRVYNNNTRYY